MAPTGPTPDAVPSGEAYGPAEVVRDRTRGRSSGAEGRELARRFGLTGEVPCAGTDLQQCQLLGDARDAKALIPSAQGTIQRLGREGGGTAGTGRLVRAA